MVFGLDMRAERGEEGLYSILGRGTYSEVIDLAADKKFFAVNFSNI
jgi:hypothetical protein